MQIPSRAMYESVAADVKSGYNITDSTPRDTTSPPNQIEHQQKSKNPEASRQATCAIVVHVDEPRPLSITPTRTLREEESMCLGKTKTLSQKSHKYAAGKSS